MAVLDAKWQVPDSYDITDREVALPPPRGFTGAAPALGILSVRALEDQATGEGQIALFAWQIMAGATDLAEQTIDRLANNLEMSGLELLVVGHAYAATGVGSGGGFETAQRARKVLKQPVTEHSIDASLLLAVTALPFGVDRVRTLLGMLDAELAHGTATHRAVHALLRAATDPDPARLDEAYAAFAALDDHFGLAQTALVGYQRELAGAKRPEVLRGYLEHAAYRFEADGRPEWAARTVGALLPLVADEMKAPAAEVGELLGRATTLGVQAKSGIAVESAFRAAAKLGYTATVATLTQYDPPVFARREGAAPSAAAAAATPAETDAKPKKTPKKGGKKKAS